MGCPARCFQLGTFFAEGEYIAFIPDDCRLIKNSLSECLQLAYNNMTNDGIILRYSEGVNYQGGDNDQMPEYWTGRFHGDQQLPGVLSEWKIAPSFMYNLSYFRELGGLDCRFEHERIHRISFQKMNKSGLLRTLMLVAILAFIAQITTSNPTIGEYTPRALVPSYRA